MKSKATVTCSINLEVHGQTGYELRFTAQRMAARLIAENPDLLEVAFND